MTAMADISAKEVMALRQKTGLSMMECKKALVETEGDVDAAIELLQKKMKGKMDTRTDRVAGEGKIAVAIDGSSAAIVELIAETDFTAKNDAFGNAVSELAKLALAQPAGNVTPTDEMAKHVDELRISTGENISIARVEKLEGGSFGSYVHHDGKTAALVQAEGDVPADVLRQICLHITAAVPIPQGVTRDDVPDEVVEKEKKLAMDMAIESGKNEEIAAKIVEGKVNKIYEELTLLEQVSVVDQTTKIKDLLPGGASIKAFRRWGVGETAGAAAAAQA
jgi:elongation factor Ts